MDRSDVQCAAQEICPTLSKSTHFAGVAKVTWEVRAWVDDQFKH